MAKKPFIDKPRCGKCKKWMTDNCPYLLRGQLHDDVMNWCFDKKYN